MNILGFEIRRTRKSNALHPEFKKLVEFVFDIDGKEYYQFKNPQDMPPLRYKKYEEFLREAELRMTGNDALDLLNLAEDCIEKSKATDAIIILRGMKYQISQFMETDTFYRLFSCIFFDLEEDLTSYDFDYNEGKIISFKAQPSVSFFFQEPVRDWLPQTNISESDLNTFLTVTENGKRHLQEIRSKILKR